MINIRHEPTLYPVDDWHHEHMLTGMFSYSPTQCGWYRLCRNHSAHISWKQNADCTILFLYLPSCLIKWAHLQQNTKYMYNILYNNIVIHFYTIRLNCVFYTMRFNCAEEAVQLVLWLVQLVPWIHVPSFCPRVLPSFYIVAHFPWLSISSLSVSVVPRFASLHSFDFFLLLFIYFFVKLCIRSV